MTALTLRIECKKGYPSLSGRKQHSITKNYSNRMKITAIKFYGGARDKIARLGLAHLFLEVQQIILDTRVLLLEVKDANSGAVVREALDKSFEAAKDWQPRKTGGIDWTKRLRYNETVLARM